jgi:hypothetical protein
LSTTVVVRYRRCATLCLAATFYTATLYHVVVPDIMPGIRTLLQQRKIRWPRQRRKDSASRPTGPKRRLNAESTDHRRDGRRQNGRRYDGRARPIRRGSDGRLVHQV